MKIQTLSIEQIASLIENKNVDAFEGVVETTFFEFREKPYFPDNDKDVVSREKSRLELLKDFSSIANSGGGYIVIGLIPGIDSSQFNLEYVSGVKGVAIENINLKGWFEILSTYLSPKFQENFVTHGIIGEEKKLFWIKIPNAKEIGCYPFLISKDQWVTENEKLLKGELYGLYFRDGSNNRQLFSAEKLQEYLARISIQDGKPNDHGRASLLEAKVDRLLALQERDNSAPKNIDLEEKKREIISNIEKKLDPETDIFYMMAIPTNEIQINKFWEKGEDDLYSLLKKPPTLRNMGWDLNVASIEYPMPAGEAWEIMNGNRKILHVNKSGVVAAAGTIQEFLDWGTRHDEDGYQPTINAFALVEYIDMYCHFLKEYSNKFVKPETKFKIIFGFVMRTGLEFQLRFTVGMFPSFAPSPLSKHEWGLGEMQTSKFSNPQSFAAEIILDVYAGGFGYVDDNPKYLKKVNDVWEVDEELYKKQ